MCWISVLVLTISQVFNCIGAKELTRHVFSMGYSLYLCIFAMYLKAVSSHYRSLIQLSSPSLARSPPAQAIKEHNIPVFSLPTLLDFPSHLEFHLVWPIALTKAERTSEIFEQVGLALDIGQKCLVNLLLVFSTRAGYLLLLQCTIRQ